MKWIVLLVILIVLVFLFSVHKGAENEIIEDSSVSKKDLVKSYHVPKATFNKWLKSFKPELWNLLKGKEKYRLGELFCIYAELGVPMQENPIVSKTDLAKKLSITTKTLKAKVERYSKEMGSYFLLYNKFNVFPPLVVDHIITVCKK